MDKSLTNSLEALIRFWENSSDPWGIRDNQSRFIYSNKENNKLMGLSDKYNVEGCLDGELPTLISEFQAEFQAHDRKVELSQDRITSAEIHKWYRRSYFQPKFCDKYPLIDENGISQGVIFHVRPVEDIILTRLNKIKVPTSLMFTPPSDLFTKREWEVLFYILHAFSSGEIAKRLQLSLGTVNNVIQKIYSKAGVTNRRQAVEYCYENKIDNYVPQSFFEYSGSFPLM
ncbi:helix-turn-helix transcriptional regulator [Yersinia alsatica]|uniref:helix-turn-helix transcriptional regulator n=1 Tax=Yersinia alsatica TaxID=2890317 RepID=UPI0011A20590|nr:PAS and helix-turn-helix domain-containing protein [Yersinia alsatica]